MTRLASEQFDEIGDDLAPNFDIAINSDDPSGENEFFEQIRELVAGVVFEDDEEMSSLFELTIINQAETAAGEPVNWRAVIDSKAFQEGNAIDLWIGYGSRRDFVDRCEIVKWLPRFEDTGPTEFTIKGFDGRHIMMRGNQLRVKTSSKTTKGVGGQAKEGKKKKTFFKNLSDEQIVKKIADKYGFGADVDQTERKKKATVAGKRVQFDRGSKRSFITSGGKKWFVDPKTKKLVSAEGKVAPASALIQHVFPTRVQEQGVSDWEFLQRLAKINRFDLWVDYDPEQGKHVVHFKKRADAGSPGFLFEYNGEDGSLISAEPDFSIHDQVTDVEVLVFDSKKRAYERTVYSDAKTAEDVRLGGRTGPGAIQAKKEITVGSRVRFSAFGQVLEAYNGKPFKSKKDAQNFVEAWLRERERDFLILTGKVIGTPSLRARQFHQIVGLGKRIDGLYRFTNVKHVMKPGSLYVCEFTAHKVLSEEVSRGKSASKTETIVFEEGSTVTA